MDQQRRNSRPRKTSTPTPTTAVEGLANALAHHCVADSRVRGACTIALETDPSDTPKQMYAAMGFRPLSVSYEYLKTFE